MFNSGASKMFRPSWLNWTVDLVVVGVLTASFHLTPHTPCDVVLQGLTFRVRLTEAASDGAEWPVLSLEPCLSSSTWHDHPRVKGVCWGLMLAS